MKATPSAADLQTAGQLLSRIAAMRRRIADELERLGRVIVEATARRTALMDLRDRLAAVGEHQDAPAVAAQIAESLASLERDFEATRTRGSEVAAIDLQLQATETKVFELTDKLFLSAGSGRTVQEGHYGRNPAD